MTIREIFAIAPVIPVHHARLLTRDKPLGWVVVSQFGPVASLASLIQASICRIRS